MERFDFFNKDELIRFFEKAKKISPLEYYEMNHNDKLFFDIALIHLMYLGYEPLGILKELATTEKKIKWLAKKNDEVVYFESHKEICIFFGFEHIRKVVNESNKNNLDGYVVKKVTILLVLDKNGDILKIIDKDKS